MSANLNQYYLSEYLKEILSIFNNREIDRIFLVDGAENSHHGEPPLLPPVESNIL